MQSKYAIKVKRYSNTIIIFIPNYFLYLYGGSNKTYIHVKISSLYYLLACLFKLEQTTLKEEKYSKSKDRHNITKLLEKIHLNYTSEYEK